MKRIAAFTVCIALTIGGCASSTTRSAGETADAGAPDSQLDLSVNCSFGDTDACKKVDSQPGGADAAAAHDAAIREELKSPEQREKDLYGP
jgi:hypothetical protein